MPVLLQINQISKAYGASVILDNATASFGSDQKIGVIGRNGAGKSTLCRIITGHEAADSGAIIKNSELRLSYLEQHDIFEKGETVLEFMMRTTDAEAWQCGQTAARFHIKNEMLDALIHSMPGGFQTRAKLTAMLLREPNFLILDEPSNYLDLSTMILLENFLCDFRGGYLIVSHDREFLKRTCDHTLEVDSGRLTLYPGDIEEYFEFKEEDLRQKQAENRTIAKKRDQLQEFINRFRAKASTAARAQSKMKQLSKLKTIEIAHELSTVRIMIPPVEPKAGMALLCEDLAIGYPEREVAAGINFEIDRGSHVAILGDNGQGKTTFLRTIAGDLPLRDGTFRWGNGIKLAYYAQHVFSSLNQEDTVYGHLLRESCGGVSNQDILDMAGCFLFKGDDVQKKVKVLSGGERARLILSGLLLSKSHVLLLDEPTNHLDFETVEALAHALQKFAGTVFFISHDRTFVNLTATQIIEVRGGKVKRYPGKYEDYVYHLEQVARGEVEEDEGGDGDESAVSKKKVGSPGTGDSRHSQKLKPRAAVLVLRKQASKAEQKMNHYTRERDKIFEEIRKNPFFHSKERNVRLKELEVLIEDAENDWCRLQEQLEKNDVS